MSLKVVDTSANALRQCLNLPPVPADPTVVKMPSESRQWSAPMQARLRGELKPAGVLVPIMYAAAEGPALLLTQRSAALKHHAAQVSFPGGTMEPEDADIVATALRETEEEVGIPASRIDVLGSLAPMPTVTGYAVTPVVGLIEDAVDITVDPGEVAYTFEVPLEFVLRPDNARLVERELQGKMVRMVEFHYQGERIWGATAMMIRRFVKEIENNIL